MNFTEKSNIYEVGARRTCEKYGAFIRATGRETLLLASWRALSPAAVQALENSANALGYGKRACAQVTICEPEERAGGTATLGTHDLMYIVEGLDPIALVAADEGSACLLCGAYRVDPAYDTASRMLGRTVVLFRDFEAMLDRLEDKRRAWTILKKLPKIE